MTADTKIVDIRVGTAQSDIVADIRSGLRSEHGSEKTLPTLLLYDELGLRLFEKITYLEEYYLTNSEIEILEKYACNIAQHIQPGSILVELGSGYGSSRQQCPTNANEHNMFVNTNHRPATYAKSIYCSKPLINSAKTSNTMLSTFPSLN